VQNGFITYPSLFYSVRELIFLIIGFIFCIIGLLAAGWGLLNADGYWRITVIIVGAIVFTFGSLAAWGGYDLKKTSLLNATVKVASKLSEQNISGAVSWISTTHKYFIIFEFPDGSRKKFKANATQYATINENDICVLRYKNLNGYLTLVDLHR